MSTDSPRTLITGSTLGSDATDPRYSFIQQSENVTASKTRRIVRSHAMRAVKRQQRQEVARSIRLKWPEELSHSERPQLAWLDGQSSDLRKPPKTAQLQERMQEEPQEGGLVSGTSILEGSEPLESPDEHDTQGIGFQNFLEPGSEAIRSFCSQEKQSSSPYTSMDVAKEATPNLTHLRTPLGEGRVDPFQTFPLHINHNLAKLTDHCEFPSNTFTDPKPFVALCSSRANIC